MFLNPAEQSHTLGLFSNFNATLVTWGLIALIGVLILKVLQEFGKLINIPIRVAILVTLLACVMDYLTGSHFQANLYTGVLTVIEHFAKK